jgi:integrase
LGSKALNERLGAIKSMLSWATRTRIIPYNPLDCLRPREHFKRHNRRALTEDEISRLMAAALDGPCRRALRIYQNRPRRDGTFKPASIPLVRQAALAQNGRRNALAYRLMLEVGLRRSEVRSVAWTDVDLAVGTLTTRSHWEGNKNGLEETLPLPPGLLAALKKWHKQQGKPTTGAIVKVGSRLLRNLDDDLVAAGIARRLPFDAEGKPIAVDAAGRPECEPACWKIVKTDAAGRTIDLHALRHTFGTRLGKIPGIDPKTVQTLMRHQDPRLTFGVYVHSDRQRLKLAAESLPEIKARSARVKKRGATQSGSDASKASGA